MHVASVKTIALLLGLIGIGLVGLEQFFDMGIPWFEDGGYIFLFLGIMTFIGGLFYSFFYQVKAEKSLHSQDGTIAAMALLRCMIAMSVADGHLDERETAMIAKIYKNLMGSDIDSDTISATATHMIQQKTDLAHEIKQIKDVLYKDLRYKIVKASLYILAADGEIDAREEERLDLIRKSFGVPKSQFKRMKAEFLKNKDL